jgi:hypothetical protein|uniref:Uncharacterized protein n=1 Tax=Zea mays TaxID=4577 RepID=B6T064_MAIZE|nr:hypothetical protein [Zea mays]
MHLINNLIEQDWRWRRSSRIPEWLRRRRRRRAHNTIRWWWLIHRSSYSIHTLLYWIGVTYNFIVLVIQEAAAGAVAAEATTPVGRKRTELELVEDYPGSGANDRHSPWAQQRRN